MLCQECRKRPATVHLIKIVNNQRTEANVCEGCAEELGDVEFLVDPKLSLQALLAGLLASEAGKLEKRTAPADRCPQCGLTDYDFAKQGRLGCGECYRHFRAKLEPLLRRVHGAITHTGKVPARGTRPASAREELAALKKELEACVRREEFERAAVIRDRIREMERPGQEGG